MMTIPLSRFGPLQIEDIEDSSGVVCYNEYFRICQVIKDMDAFDGRGDRSPIRMAELFSVPNPDYPDYKLDPYILNFHTIFQVSGCPISCPCCYVDNLKEDVLVDARDIVPKYADIMCDLYEGWGYFSNVLHMMGGCPGRYSKFWIELRSALDDFGFDNMVLFSDVILLENFFWKNEPWNNMDISNFMLTGSLKGLDKDTFIHNTGFDYYNKAMKELEHYVDKPNFYLTVLPLYEGQYTEEMYSNLYNYIPKDKVDTLSAIKYKASPFTNEDNQLPIPL